MAFISFEAPVGPNDREVGREPPPGRDLADLLMHGLQAAGFGIVEPLSQHDSYGWCFTVDSGESQPVWCMLQLSDEWLLITHSRQPLLRRLFGAEISAEHEKFDVVVARTLSSMPGVLNVRRFRTEEDMRHGHASEP